MFLQLKGYIRLARDSPRWGQLAHTGLAHTCLPHTGVDIYNAIHVRVKLVLSLITLTKAATVKSIKEGGGMKEWEVYNDSVHVIMQLLSLPVIHRPVKVEPSLPSLQSDTLVEVLFELLRQMVVLKPVQEAARSHFFRAQDGWTNFAAVLEIPLVRGAKHIYRRGNAYRRIS